MSTQAVLYVLAIIFLVLSASSASFPKIADSAELATLAGERTRYLWPDSYDLRRVDTPDEKVWMPKWAQR